MSEVIELSSEDEKDVKSIVVQKKKKVKVWRKDEKQPTLINYFTKTSENYFSCHKESSIPTSVVQPVEDFSMSQFLEVEIAENKNWFLNESDLKVKEGVELQCITESVQSSSNVLEDLMNKIYAQDFDVNQVNLGNKLVAVESESEKEETAENEGESSKSVKKKKKAICPAYKIVEGSFFAVDGFRYGEISFVEHYFLTHFHADHYIGLRKKFKHKIYLSQITATLVTQFIGVNEELLNVVHVGVPFLLEDCKITPIDANHCPGALLFLFQFPDGRNVLHTGDFRANDAMVHQLEKWNVKLDLIYLDTTYLGSKRRMPPQNESIEFLLKHVQRYLEQIIGEKFMIIVGAYLIGKEKCWMAIAKHFNFKVFLEKERLKAFKAICSCSAEHLEVFKKYVVEDEESADMRVVNMIQTSYPNLRDFLRENQDSFNTILGVVASGWENQKYSPGRISLLHVQYSEHSSYDELENFIVKTQPKNVISTVPVRMNSAITPDVPKEWMAENVKPRKKSNQKQITDKRKK